MCLSRLEPHWSLCYALPLSSYHFIFQLSSTVPIRIPGLRITAHTRVSDFASWTWELFLSPLFPSRVGVLSVVTRFRRVSLDRAWHSNHPLQLVGMCRFLRLLNPTNSRIYLPRTPNVYVSYVTVSRFKLNH
jgi:hypothetical protein